MDNNLFYRYDKLSSQEIYILFGFSGLILAFLYKIWRVIQIDKKIEELEYISQKFRYEITNELHELKTEQESLKAENIRLNDDLFKLRASLNICQSNHSKTCLFLNRLKG